MNIKNKQTSVWNHKVSPRESAWLKLDAKLDKNRSIRTINMYKYTSIAAVMVGILGILSIMYPQNNILQPHHNASETYTVDVFDFSDDKTVGIYEVSKLRNLKIAYNKHTAKQKI